MLAFGSFSWFPPQSVALTVLTLCVVAASGLALGSIRIRGFTLGIPGVMFTGLVVSRLLGHENLNEQVMSFMRDFGLILFVYAVGVQVGPSFLASLRRSGLKLNLMAASIVLLGAIICIALHVIAKMDMRSAVGLFAGGTTNAPAFGSATEALKSLPGHDAIREAGQLTGPAFAISYPFGLMGVILAMVLIRRIFRVNPQQEAEAIEASEKDGKAIPHTLNIELKNANLDNLTLDRINDLHGDRVVISRVLHKNALVVAKPDLQLSLGDVLLAVGPQEELNDLRLIVGEESKVDLRQVPSQITTRQILVTKNAVLGKTVDELDLASRLGVTITRVSRTGLEFTAIGDLTLQFGDTVRAVGEPTALDAAAKQLGNSPRELNIPRLLPIFCGIAIGVILGSMPIWVGLPAPVKLGLASGPMIVAIVLSRLGRVGRLIWYMPHSASSLLREMGIVLFLVAVGLNAGKGFFDNLFSMTGLSWLILGAVVTLLPLLIVGFIARKTFKMHYLHVCGLLAGSMTSPSLAFTQTMTSSEAPAVAFATVYPLTMVLRVLLAQLLILIFVR